MCVALSDAGIDLLLATTNDDLGGGNGSAPVTCEKIDHYRGVSAIFFPRQIGASFKYSRPFAQWLKTNVANFDLVHIHAVFNHACIAAARACSRQAVPYIVRPLGTLDPWAMDQKSLRKKLFWHGGVKSVLDSAAAVHYTAGPEKQATEQSLGLNHGVVIPLGIDLPPEEARASQHALAQKLPSLNQRPYVLVLSRLLPTKGLDVLLAAFLTLSKQPDFAEWRLVFGGEGPPEYVGKLKATVTLVGADEKVLFPGWLDGEEKEAALSRAALLALPSYHENFGLCVMEALANGVPVLVSPQVNLAEEVQTSGAGWVATIDQAAIQSALQDAMSSSTERVKRGAAGRTLARNYSWPVIATRLTNLYASILASHN